MTEEAPTPEQVVELMVTASRSNSEDDTRAFAKAVIAFERYMLNRMDREVARRLHLGRWRHRAIQGLAFLSGVMLGAILWAS